MKIEAWVLMVLMSVLIASLMWSGWNFALARQEIAKCNHAVVERCEIMECDISPLGNLNCQSSGIPEDWYSRNPELQTFNMSEWVTSWGGGHNETNGNNSVAGEVR